MRNAVSHRGEACDMKKRRIVFVVIYAVLIFINTIPVFIYRDKVQTAFSWLFWL